MKMKWAVLLALIMLLLLAACGACAEEMAEATIDLVFDGKTYTDTVQVEWTEKYPVPEGGVKWDGTDEFVSYDYKYHGAIVPLENESYYVDGQIIFTAKLESTFSEIEMIVAKQNARVIGYIALTNSYAIEVIGNKSYNNLQNVMAELKKESAIYKDSVCLNYAYETKIEMYNITDPWEYDFATALTPKDWVDRSELRIMRPYNWRAIAINAPKAWNYVDYMAEMNVGVVDAVFPEKHPDIAYAHVEDEYYKNNRKYSGNWFSSQDEENGAANHGTIISGIIAAKHNNEGIGGIFPKGNIVAVGVFGDNNRGEFITGYTQACAFAECIDREAKIINVSLGWKYQHNFVNKNEINGVYNEFFENLRRKNKEFLVIISAGNEDCDTEKVSYFVHVDNEYFKNRLIVVSGYEWGNGRPSFREGLCWGKRVDILAPGSCIFSTCLKSYHNLGRDYEHDLVGTSFAAPHVAGVAAMMWSIHPELTGEIIKNTIMKYGERIPDSHEYEHPVLDAYACVQDVLGIGSINGLVKVGLNGLEGAEVNISQNGDRVVTLITDTNGQFCSDLPVGEYLLSINEDGYKLIEKNIVVSPGHDVTDTLSLEKAPENICVGDYLTLGEYLGEPIVWRCVGIDANGPLMLSDKILCFKAFDVAGNYDNYLRRIHGSNHWETSSLKHWLNSEETVNWSGRASIPNKASCFDGYNAYDTEAGFLSCFTQEERKLIKFVTQKTYLHHLEKDLAVGGTSALKTGGNSTFAEFTANMPSKTADKWYYNSQEYFFVMGPEQLKMVYDNLGSDYIMAKATAGARNSDESKTTKEDINYMYWLRLPCNEGMNYENIRIVDSMQRIYYGGVRGAVDGEIYHSVGVRPAFYLNVSE